MEECIFCKIVGGEFNTEMLYEDEVLAVFKDINPQAKVHYLIVPKQHYQNILALNISENGKEIFAHLLQVLPRIADLAGVGKSGFRLLTNCGKNAGQTVEHLHFHLLGGENLEALC